MTGLKRICVAVALSVIAVGCDDRGGAPTATATTRAAAVATSAFADRPAFGSSNAESAGLHAPTGQQSLALLVSRYTSGETRKSIVTLKRAGSLDAQLALEPGLSVTVVGQPVLNRIDFAARLAHLGGEGRFTLGPNRVIEENGTPPPFLSAVTPTSPPPPPLTGPTTNEAPTTPATPSAQVSPIADAVQAQMFRSHVLFNIRSNLVGDSSRTQGNGCLVTSTFVLTARHVAKAIQERAGDYYVTCNPSGGLPVTRNCKSFVYFDEDEKADLALIEIDPVGDPPLIKPAAVNDIKIDSQVFVVGAWRYATDVLIGGGLVRRCVADQPVGTSQRTVFGATTWGMNGVSGSPVFNIEGRLVGIQVDGGGRFGQRFEPVATITRGKPLDKGEFEYTFVNPNSGKEEIFDDWSWIVPIAPYWDQIGKHTSK